LGGLCKSQAAFDIYLSKLELIIS